MTHEKVLSNYLISWLQVWPGISTTFHRGDSKLYKKKIQWNFILFYSKVLYYCTVGLDVKTLCQENDT